MYKVKITTCWFGQWREQIRTVTEMELQEICKPGVRVDILEVL